MQVKITRPWKCAPEGHTIVRYNVGDVVEGRAAALAISDNAGIELRSSEPAPKKKPAPKKTPRPKVTKPAKPDHEG